MAVWGTPVATEDDAERAVRAALDLVAAVSALGDEVGAESLRARAGVLTGEAAVTIGAEGEGMVAGDLVNTASRIQSTAPPGSVYVGTPPVAPPSRRSPTRTPARTSCRAKRACSRSSARCGSSPARAGRSRPTGLEAPFVGRDRELRLIKELFHGVADDRTAHLVSIIGFAGIGKSRLAWEFFKYIDGLPRHLLASRPLPLLRRGRRPTGRWRTWSGCAAGSPRTKSTDSALAQAPRGARRARPRRGANGASSSRACPSARPRGAAALRARRSLRGMAALLRAPERSRTRWRWCSRTCSGRTTRCSTSSTTCSSGRASSRSSSARSPARSSTSDRRPGARAGAASPRSTSSRSPASAMEQLLDGLVPGPPRASSRRRSSSAPKASRCTPSRPCG